ncbi:MAG: DUF3466 family protein [Armatimonadetes bacterium]|nr:DUF3466 family protein [Armatimonadota bacterium]
MNITVHEAITALLQATGGGLLVATFAWLFCRILSKLSASVRFALWWMVGAKFLLGLAFALFGVAALRVPVLKAEHYQTIRAVARQTVAQAVPARKTAKTKDTPGATPGAARTATTAISDPVAPAFRVSWWRQAATDALALYALPLCAAYLAGVVFLIGRGVFAARRLRLSIAGATPCEDTGTLSDAEAMRGRVGLHELPPIFVSLRTSAPFVVGAFVPRIVLPAAFLAQTSANRQMALAHEMAHIKRGDLFWEIVPVCLRVLFWFLPTAHMAANEIAFAREEACDLAALAATRRSPGAYAALLVTVAEHARSPLPAMAMVQGNSPGYVQVRRRLQTLRREGHGKPTSLFWRGVAVAVIVAQGAATALPLRPVLARVAVAARAALPAPPLPVYTVTDLGTLGGKESGALAINDTGQVVGAAHIYPRGSHGHAFLWDDSGLHDLAAGSVYRHSQAVAVAENGYVAGFVYRSSYRAGQQNAFLWNGSRRLILPPAPGYRFAKATGISETGAVVGASLTGRKNALGATQAQATLWQNNRVQALGTLGGDYSVALGVGANGVVVGKADVSEGRTSSASGTNRTHPFAWSEEGNEMHDLGTLGGEFGAAMAGNRSGAVVGYAQTARGATHAFVTPVSNLGFALAKPKDLGTLPGDASSAAYAVNDSGNIVGSSGDEPPSSARRTGRAALWLSPDAEAIDLNTRLLPGEKSAGWHLETARGINASGQIVGQGTVRGVRHAYLLTPVP